MNNVKRMLDLYGGKRVWFYLKDNKTKDDFLNDLIDLNATWFDGESLKADHVLSCYIAVHDDLKIGFITNLCWKMSFVTNKEIVHIDFETLRQMK